MSTPRIDPYLTTDARLRLALALDPKAIFQGTRTFADGTTCEFSARADLYVIQAAWNAGCDFEDLADGYGAGQGTHDDWSGIRDSSASAVAAMYAKAKLFLTSTTFKQLAVGATFEFANSPSGAERGPWRKVSARRYAKTGPRAMVCTVGTVNVAVVEAQTDSTN